MLRLLDADLLCTRIFDVADTIGLEECRALIARGGAEIRRLSLRREGSEFIQLSDPPLLVDLGARSLTVQGLGREVKVSAALFHHGAISISVRVPVPKGTTVDELIPVADELYDSKLLEALALEEVTKLRKLLEPHFEGAHLWDQTEGYTVIFARELEGKPTAEQVLATPGLARLLLGEKDVLSAAEEREVLAHHFSYTPNDSPSSSGTRPSSTSRRAAKTSSTCSRSPTRSCSSFGTTITCSIPSWAACTTWLASATRCCSSAPTSAWRAS